MCFAIPGKVVEIDFEGNCLVDYSGEKRDVKLLMEGIEVGDYVIVQNKIVVSKIDKEKALKFLELQNVGG
jgi:hydrogenase expression/formation protein HypC